MPKNLKSYLKKFHALVYEIQKTLDEDFEKFISKNPESRVERIDFTPLLTAFYSDALQQVTTLRQDNGVLLAINNVNNDDVLPNSFDAYLNILAHQGNPTIQNAAAYIQENQDAYNALGKEYVGLRRKLWSGYRQNYQQVKLAYDNDKTIDVPAQFTKAYVDNNQLDLQFFQRFVSGYQSISVRNEFIELMEEIRPFLTTQGQFEEIIDQIARKFVEGDGGNPFIIVHPLNLRMKGELRDLDKKRIEIVERNLGHSVVKFLNGYPYRKAGKNIPHPSSYLYTGKADDQYDQWQGSFASINSGLFLESTNYFNTTDFDEREPLSSHKDAASKTKNGKGKERDASDDNDDLPDLKEFDANEYPSAYAHIQSPSNPKRARELVNGDGAKARKKLNIYQLAEITSVLEEDNRKLSSDKVDSYRPAYGLADLYSLQKSETIDQLKRDIANENDRANERTKVGRKHLKRGAIAGGVIGLGFLVGGVGMAIAGVPFFGVLLALAPIALGLGTLIGGIIGIKKHIEQSREKSHVKSVQKNGDIVALQNQIDANINKLQAQYAEVNGGQKYEPTVGLTQTSAAQATHANRARYDAQRRQQSSGVTV